MALTSSPTPPAPPGPGTSGSNDKMPPHIFFFALSYLTVLITLFIVYSTWSGFRAHVPATLGQIPVGVVWFGATGAVIASMYGIFVHSQSWDSSYNYWHYCRPLFGAVTASVGALFYLVSLELGTTNAVRVDRVTFYVVAFILGFADKSFIQLLQNVTALIIKPSQRAPG